jgi:hypothetical protein
MIEIIPANIPSLIVIKKLSTAPHKKYMINQNL